MKMIGAHVMCKMSDCHGNVGGLCKILEREITGKPCPFYKSEKRLMKELMALDEHDWDAYHEAQHIDD